MNTNLPLVVPRRKNMQLLRQFHEGREAIPLSAFVEDYLSPDPGSESLLCSSALIGSGNTLLTAP